ncbi:hypothetical protein TALC_00360 [Thermoplasmatales archaeon BRNA1]|nr:hypothetical protein TALC_00360 [Thermoplasmatales archaeon BRNA1]
MNTPSKTFVCLYCRWREFFRDDVQASWNGWDVSRGLCPYCSTILDGIDHKSYLEKVME